MPARYHDGQHVYEADTCAPLKAAAASGRLRLAAVSHGAYPGRVMGPRTLPEVRSAGLWDADEPQNWGLAWHRNEGLELTYLAAGRMPLAVQEQRCTLRPNQFALTRPWQAHRLGDPTVPASRLIWLILDVKVRRPHQAWRWPPWLLMAEAERDQLAHTLRHSRAPVCEADEPTAHAFERLAEWIGQHGSCRWQDTASERGHLRPDAAPDDAAPLDDALPDAAWTRLKLAINELLLCVAQRLADQPIELDASLARTEHSVELFLTQELPSRLAEPWDLPRMAAACGLGKTRFVEHTRRLLNASPTEHLTRLRVQAAHRLLQQPRRKRSLSDIALACGFSSSQYFATVFRRHTGLTPSQAARATVAP